MAFLRSVIRYNLVTRKVTNISVVQLSTSSAAGGPSQPTPASVLNNSTKCQQKLNPIIGGRSQTTAVAAQIATETTDNNPGSAQPPRDRLDVSFNDPNAAFKSKTTFELIRAYLVYTLCSSEKLVEHNMKVKLTSFLF